MDVKTHLKKLYEDRGERPHDLEGMSQLAHALQAAALAEQSGATPEFVVAALLHDIGHLIQPFGENPAAIGIDHCHERLGAAWLQQFFGPEVHEPVRWHVEAKRYLCTTKPAYKDRLSQDSIRSLKLQGGPMTPVEIGAFEARPFSRDAVRLRYLDEAAKVIDAETPDLDHYLSLVEECARKNVRSFAGRGVIVLRDFFDTRDTAFLQDQANSLGSAAAHLLELASSAGRSPQGLAREDASSLIVVPELDAPMTVCRFEFLQGASPELRDFAANAIAPLLFALLDEPFTPFKDKENEKHPGGGAFRPHQDYAAYQAFGPRFNATAMISIDAATRENGCLEFATNADEVAHAHPEFVEHVVDGRALFRSYEGGPKNGDVIDEVVDALEWDTVETSPHDLVLFDSFVPHRSPINASKKSRRAMFLTYNRVSEGNWYDRYYAEKRSNFHDPKFHVSTPTV